MAYPGKPYVSLEALDIRDFALSDPRGFLGGYSGGAVLDEIQHVPQLLTYLQSDIDARTEPGRFILTGPQHFGLSESIAQSLAGRCSILVLLPPSLEELAAFPAAPSVTDHGVRHSTHAGTLQTGGAFTGCCRWKTAGTQTYSLYFKYPPTKQMRYPVKAYRLPACSRCYGKGPIRGFTIAPSRPTSSRRTTRPPTSSAMCAR